MVLLVLAQLFCMRAAVRSLSKASLQLRWQLPIRMTTAGCSSRRRSFRDDESIHQQQS